MVQGKFQFSTTASKPKIADTKPSQARPPAKTPRILTVTQVTRLIKKTLNEHLPGKILLQGEMSNCKHHVSGHLYLTLKDDNAQLVSVMWKTAAAKLKFKPADGMAVIATGRIDVYEPHGKYQFYIEKLEPAGLGALELAFRQLAEKLRTEGLFDEAAKKALRFVPRTIAIVTGEGSAALEDIRKTLQRRFPIVRKLFFPVPVQGEGAAARIAKTLQAINRRATEWDSIDLILLARGGGSIEDLWAFNEEAVARAIHQSEIPIITGIGHEIDVTIADMAADHRAATPTAAAEMATPVLAELRQTVDQWKNRVSKSMRHTLSLSGQSLTHLAKRPLLARPLDLVGLHQQTLDQQHSGLSQGILERFRSRERQLEHSMQTLRQIEPHRAMGQARLRLTEYLSELCHRMRTSANCRTNLVKQMALRLHAHHPVASIDAGTRQLIHIQDRLQLTNRLSYDRCRQSAELFAKRLENLNPRNILRRGYSITRLKESGVILKSADQGRPGQPLLTELAGDLVLESEITKVAVPKKGKK